MPETLEEAIARADKAVTDLVTKTKEVETLTESSTTLTASMTNLKVAKDKVDVELVTALAAPATLQAEIDKHKDVVARFQNEAEGHEEVVKAKETAESQAAERGTALETVTKERDELQGSVRSGLVTALITRGFKEEALKGNDLASLQTLSSSFTGSDIKPDATPGQGLENGGGQGDAKGPTEYELADKELQAAGTNKP